MCLLENYNKSGNDLDTTQLNTIKTQGSIVPPGDITTALVISFQGFGNAPHVYSFIKTVYQYSVTCKGRLSFRQCYLPTL